MTLRRRYLRVTKPRLGTIYFNDGLSEVNCTMRNYSSNGALLKLHKLTHLSSDFELVVDDDQSRLMCRVVWRQGDLLGVQFKSEWKWGHTDEIEVVDKTIVSKKSVPS